MKKGVSPLISYVLLVGFAIAMAAIVYNFVITQTEKLNPDEMTGTKEICNEMALGVSEICSTGTGIKLTLSNKGSFTVHKINIDTIDAGGASTIPGTITKDASCSCSTCEGLPPGCITTSKSVEISYSRSSDSDEISIVPIRTENYKDTVCQEGKITYNGADLVGLPAC